MKNILSTSILMPVLIILLNSCETNYTTTLPEFIPPSKPAGGVYKCEVIDQNANELTLEAEFYAVNAYGTFIQNLDIDQISFEDENGNSIDLLESNLEQRTTPFNGEFSAMMLFDDSGSISGTDPYDDRVEAGKAMVKLIRENEEVSVSRFTSDLSNKFEILSPFSNDTSTLIPLIEDLVLGENGGTPLYYSIDHMIDTIETHASNQNKALIAFTDGADTYGGADIDNIIQKANAFNIPIYTIGLGTNTDLSELAQIAYDTGGAVMLADDAIQLIALYTSLADLLRGGTNLYRLRITIPSLRFQSGQHNSFVKITLADGEEIRLQLSFSN